MSHSYLPNPLAPAIAVAERQLGILGELANMALEVSRGYAAAALSASHAVEVTLADQEYQPETERARALAGAKDAADGFQKVARTLRLTLRLELTTADMLGQLYAGTYATPVARPSAPTRATVGPPSFLEETVDLDRPSPAASDSDQETFDIERRESDYERLVDTEHPDRKPREAFRETVDEFCADLGAAVDWTTWKFNPASVKYRPLTPRPLGGSESRPSDSVMPPADAADREQALAP